MSAVGGNMTKMPTPTIPELLDFEARHPNHPGGKQQAIESELGITAARYYQLLGRAIDDPAADKLDPLLVHRLRRLRDRAELRQRAATFAS